MLNALEKNRSKVCVVRHQTELSQSWQLVASEETYVSALEALSEGIGPVGVDAERASGYKYRQSAYLVQVSQRNVGTFLFDPVELKDFSELNKILNAHTWIFHAASQDLPCLREIGLSPENIFDTELAARLLGIERVNLANVVEQMLGITLEKAHSAVDWSTRPLPLEWAEYAAFDVALLPDLREALTSALEAENKLEYAKQEFIATLKRPAKLPDPEPWRKLIGHQRATTPIQQTIVRELWNARDTYAAEKDVAPGRVLPDSSILAAAFQNPRSPKELSRNRNFSGKASRTEMDRWWHAILKAKTAEPPAPRIREPNSIPHHRSWPQRYPEAAERLAKFREAIQTLSTEMNIPAENLMPADVLKRLAWEPPESTNSDEVLEHLSQLGARQWQSELATPVLVSLL